jgi:hypothetical protein
MNAVLFYGNIMQLLGTLAFATMAVVNLAVAVLVVSGLCQRIRAHR